MVRMVRMVRVVRVISPGPQKGWIERLSRIRTSKKKVSNVCACMPILVYVHK